MTNFLAAYSPDRNFQTEEEYLTLYPDDDIVDILGIDNYWDLQSPEGRRDAIKKLEIVANYALKTGKIAAFTETGSDKLLNDKWFTEMLGYVLNASSLTRQIVYVMVWPNHDLSHFYVPYPEHPAAVNFRTFTDQQHVWLLNEWVSFVEAKE